jgi:hypothetical protein
MRLSCSECIRLQRERMEANNALLIIVSEIQRATIEHDHAALAQAQASYREGMERCKAARLAFKEHRETHD